MSPKKRYIPSAVREAKRKAKTEWQRKQRLSLRLDVDKYVEYLDNDIKQIEKEVFFKQYKTQAGITMPMAFEHRMQNSMRDVWVEEIVIGLRNCTSNGKQIGPISFENL